ncbi:MAG: cytidylate kinase-like family protein [Deltaproteobacteria bacterium]|nr:cytidylate kinase-like family protein [Deltaproteobacteria bacterium]
MKTKSRSIGQMIQEQVHKWERVQPEDSQEKDAHIPVITIAREPGTRGSLVAEGIAQRLGLDVFHRKIIEQVAESSEISASLLETMDEKRLSFLDHWISAIVNERHLWPDEFLEHLMKVILAVAEKGRVVIVGRGANFILPPEGSFRVRIVAPLEVRIQNVMSKYDVPLKEAKRRIRRTELDRRAFVRKHFHADIDDPVNYDLVINTGSLSVDGAVGAVVGGISGNGGINIS